MNKTPVSILQEMMVKKHTVPDYELIYDGGGTHINTFTYKVNCDGLSANGSGRSKKDAKHEAAKAMLETIAAHRGYPQLPASPAESPVRTPLPPTLPEPQRLPPNVPFVNAIGALQDICIENKLSGPEYELISDIGPPHAKIFTIQCTVTTFKEVGVARTKKQAKQDAARKMLHKITDLVADLESTNLYSMNEEEEKRKIEQISSNVKKMYISLSKLNLAKKVNLGFKLSEYHTKIKNCFSTDVSKELIEKLELLIPQDQSNISKEFVENLSFKFKEFLLTIDLDISVMSLKSIKEDTVIIGMGINTCPDIVQFSMGKTKAEAEFYTLLKLINTMIVFLQ